ncbi:MAG: hypothetical protein ACXVHB_19395 [Solirubrobacteraceae bacterium]
MLIGGSALIEIEAFIERQSLAEERPIARDIADSIAWSSLCSNTYPVRYSSGCSQA